MSLTNACFRGIQAESEIHGMNCARCYTVWVHFVNFRLSRWEYDPRSQLSLSKLQTCTLQEEPELYILRLYVKKGERERERERRKEKQRGSVLQRENQLCSAQSCLPVFFAVTKYLYLQKSRPEVLTSQAAFPDCVKKKDCCKFCSC